MSQQVGRPRRPTQGTEVEYVWGESDRVSISNFATTTPVIITCALTGGIHGKEANENLPEQPDEIVEQGVAAWNAGAAILHVHARNPDGSNTMDRGLYSEIHQRLCAETDAIIQLTTGGSPVLTVDERITTAQLAPEMCSLNMGMLNFFIRGEQVFFSNHRSDILRFANEMSERRVTPELEVYNSAMLEEAKFLFSQEILEPPYAINFVLNTPTQGGQPGTPYNLNDMMLRLRELPVDENDLRITVSSMGRTQLPITTIAMAMGLNIRVGMEDNVYYRRGEPLKNNAQLVERAVRIARELDRVPATPDQAREMLGTRGREPGKIPV
jgi:3-keto-5-aminohexanoate cleavage enzyme